MFCFFSTRASCPYDSPSLHVFLFVVPVSSPTKVSTSPVFQNWNREILFLKPKSVIRHAVTVSDWENEAFGQIARFCPHPVPQPNDRFGLKSLTFFEIVARFDSGTTVSTPRHGKGSGGILAGACHRNNTCGPRWQR